MAIILKNTQNLMECAIKIVYLQPSKNYFIPLTQTQSL